MRCTHRPRVAQNDLICVDGWELIGAGELGSSYYNGFFC